MPSRRSRPPVCLSIAGSDSGGGAGIQADLKAFARCAVHGTTAIAALTAQNTLAVNAIASVEPDFVQAQVRAVAEDIGVDAVKVGMLGDSATIAAVAGALELVGRAPIVVDPVMVAESGAALLEADAELALVEAILPLARVVTPNLAEARRLAAHAASDDAGAAAEPDAAALAGAIRSLGPAAAIVTGGHAEDGVDVLDDAGSLARIDGPRHGLGAAHGSGCTHSSALAAFLAHGLELSEAARWARVVASEAVERGLRGIGEGAGPVDALGLERIAAGALGSLPPLA